MQTFCKSYSNRASTGQMPRDAGANNGSVAARHWAKAVSSKASAILSRPVSRSSAARASSFRPARWCKRAARTAFPVRSACSALPQNASRWTMGAVADEESGSFGRSSSGPAAPAGRVPASSDAAFTSWARSASTCEKSSMVGK